jgi:hypothetical protein
MAEMGKYCKAYLAQDLRKYSGWAENLENLRQEEAEDGKEAEKRTELKDDDILYLQENYVVTDGIFIDENIIFDDANDEWKAFCTDGLTSPFEIPVYEPIVIEANEASSEAAEETSSDA